MPIAEKSILPDAVPRNWVDRFAPPWLLPYAKLARWDRPIGWWLLLFPCWWSVALAAGAADKAPDLWHLLLFLIGAIAMRGAGCTYNDIVDRDIDAKVARTRVRPLPAGDVNLLQAAAFLVAQAAIGFLVLLQFNRFTEILGLAALLPVAIYPFMKRVTNWPQLFLGYAFSWGALMGWSALFGVLDWPAIFLFAGCVLWTIGYDTIYALQDREDDAVIGVRSTALLFGARARAAIGLFYAGTIVVFALAFSSAMAGPISLLGLGASAVQLGWQVLTLRPDDPESCLRAFRSNRLFGWIVFGGLAADAMLRAG